MSCIIEGANARSETSEVKDFSAAVFRVPYVLGVQGLSVTLPTATSVVISDTILVGWDGAYFRGLRAVPWVMVFAGIRQALRMAVASS